MSGHTHIHTYIHTYIHTHTHDNYYNPRCAHAHRGLITDNNKCLLALKLIFLLLIIYVADLPFSYHYLITFLYEYPRLHF